MKTFRTPFSIILLFAFLANIGCKENKSKTENLEPQQMEKSLSFTKSDFGNTADGQAVAKYTLENKGGIQVDIITYGGRITSLRTPDKNGKMANVILGFDSIEQYEKDNPFLEH